MNIKKLVPRPLIMMRREMLPGWRKITKKNMQQKTKEIQNLIQWLTIKDHIANKDRRLCTTTDGKEYNNCRKTTQQLICSRTTVDVRL